MPRISIGDCELYYEREGSGFPVLFITGLAGYANFWRDQVPSFARSYTTIAYDHRGVGQSEQNARATSSSGWRPTPSA